MTSFPQFRNGFLDFEQCTKTRLWNKHGGSSETSRGQGDSRREIFILPLKIILQLNNFSKNKHIDCRMLLGPACNTYLHLYVSTKGLNHFLNIF